MKLIEIIKQIEQYIEDKHPITKSFARPKKLIAALYELDNMVEMDNVKEIISKHLRYIIVSKNFKNELLNTMIYGPPGVGKTEVGTILAKIWSSLGILSGQKTPKSNMTMPDRKLFRENCSLKHKHKLIKKRIDKLRNNPRGNLINKLKSYAVKIHSDLSIAEDLDKMIKFVTNNPSAPKFFGKRYMTLIQNIREHSDSIKQYKTMQEDIMTIQRVLIANESTLCDASVELDVDSKEEDEPLPFVIAKPHDFIGQYIGETAIKSEQFLEKHKGKVIFIDEAYTLAEKRYGLEALTVINRAITERPNEFIFQFGGYKDLMRQINDVQPGLDRRCSFVIDIEKYSSDGLFTIFQKQLKEYEKDIRQNDVDEIKQFFSTHKDKLTHFGGDTKKLAYYTNVEHSLDKFAFLDNDDYEKCITYDQFKRGFDFLIKNKSNDKHSDPPFGIYG